MWKISFIRLLFIRLSVLNGSEQQKAQQLSQLQQQLSQLQQEKTVQESRLETSKQNSSDSRKMAEQVFLWVNNTQVV